MRKFAIALMKKLMPYGQSVPLTFRPEKKQTKQIKLPTENSHSDKITLSGILKFGSCARQPEVEF